MADTAIEWASKVWNPTTGCDKVSPGCDNCYALTMAKRLKGMGSAKYQRDGDPRTSGPGFGVTGHPSTLSNPLSWRIPQRIFVNSMSDLFHDEVPAEFIAEVFAVMATARHHTFQVLTKRHGRMRSLLNSDAFVAEVTEQLHRYADPTRGGNIPTGPWDGPGWWPLPNVWLGVSTENQYWADRRIPALLKTPAAVRFISAEPLLGPIALPRDWVLSRPYWGEPTPTLAGPGAGGSIDMHPLLTTPVIDWVIVGGESGRGARPMHLKWAQSLRDQCVAADVPFLFKQWGEWAPAPWHGVEGATHAFTGGLYQDESGAWVENFMEIGHNPMSPERDRETPPGAQGMRRLGKKAAGRELDGRTWDQYPEPTHV